MITLCFSNNVTFLCVAVSNLLKSCLFFVSVYNSFLVCWSGIHLLEKSVGLWSLVVARCFTSTWPSISTQHWKCNEFWFLSFWIFHCRIFNVIFHMYFKYKPIKCLNHVNSHVPITFNRMANNICGKKREKKNCHQVFYALKLLCTKSVRHCCSIFLLNRGKSFTIIRDYGVC